MDLENWSLRLTVLKLKIYVDIHYIHHNTTQNHDLSLWQTKPGSCYCFPFNWP